MFRVFGVRAALALGLTACVNDLAGYDHSVVHEERRGDGGADAVQDRDSRSDNDSSSDDDSLDDECDTDADTEAPDCHISCDDAYSAEIADCQARRTITVTCVDIAEYNYETCLSECDPAPAAE